MTIEDERLWLEERLQAMDPTINLNDGSPANIQVVEPFVRRFQPDPLETSIMSFIQGRLRQEFPNISAEEGDVFTDLTAKPMSILLEPFRREIRAIKRNQSIQDPAIINSDEADAIVANTFFTRNAGAYSRGKVRIYFANPITLSLGSSNVAYTAGGKRFLIATPQSITSESMSINTEGNLYYWDVDFVAEATGKSYDVAVGSIIGVTGISSATKVTNPYKFSGGITEETTTELVARSEENIGERSLNTVPGAVAKLFEEFADLRVLQIIGFNDEEMERDVITGGSLGDVFLYGTDGVATDEGDGYSSYFDSASGTFTTDFGPVGTDISAYVLTIWLTSGTTRPVDYTLGAVEGATRLSISSTYTHATRIPAQTATNWTIRKREITLSDIPGGILFPDTDGNELVVEPDTIHVGGCSDYYVTGNSRSDQTMSLTQLADRDPIVKGLYVQTYDGTTEPADRVDVTMTNDEYDEIVATKSMLRILDSASGNNVGTYRIVQKVQYTGGVGELVLDQDLVSPEESAVFGELTDDIDVELNNPYEVVLEGDDLRTYAGLAIVNTVAGTIFTDYGMTAGAGTTDNKLIILSGNDAGTYDITNVASTVLTLGSTLSDTTSPIPYRVVREMAEDGIDLPLWRIRDVDLLDANSEPTGDVIPYRHPVDVQSRRFANIGREPKAGEGTTTDDTVASTASSDIITSSSGSLNYWNLGVRLNDVVNLNTGDNTGYYLVTGVGGGPAPIGTGLSDNQLKLNETLTWADATITYEVGEPSVGSFRVYFLNPCTAEVTSDDTLFSVDVGGTTRRFRPDPTMNHQYLPSESTVPTAILQDGGARPADVILLYTPDGATGVRAWNYDIQANDYAEITYAPIVGAVDLTTATAGLDGKSLLLDLGSGSERVTFSTSGTMTSAEIVTQINAQLSSSVASIYTVGGEFLMFRGDISITLEDNSGAPGAGDATGTLMDTGGNPRTTYMPWLTGNFANQDTVNDAPTGVKGKWVIDTVNPLSSDRFALELGAHATDSGVTYSSSYAIDTTLGHYVRLSRNGLQRISSVDMTDNEDELGLYYWDVECTSEGHGDSWNIDPDLSGTVTDYYSEGWEASVEDDTVSYSMSEAPWVHISPRVLLSGDDDPSNYLTLLEESAQLDYQREDIVESIHSFIRSPSERTVNNNPLARALTPTLVRTSISYSNGYTESEAREEIADAIEAVMPNRQLEVSDMVKILTDGGATYVTLPITLIGISHQVDRTVTIERSEDYISSDRLSVLVPDDDGSTVEGNSYILLTRS